MSAEQEERFSRVAEGIHRYVSGRTHLGQRVAGKPARHKLKISDLQESKRGAQSSILGSKFVYSPLDALHFSFSGTEIFHSRNGLHACGIRSIPP